MDRVTKTAWRAFWIGLGAATVLIGHALVVPAPAASFANVAPAPPAASVPHDARPWARTAEPAPVFPRLRSQS